MVKKLEIKCSKEDFENLFQFLLKSSFKNIESFMEKENGRLNKKFFFKDKNEWKKIIPYDYHMMINFLISELKNYKSPFSKEKIGFLNRIQVIESNFINKSLISVKGKHIFSLHCDRINSYKIYMCFSDIKLKDGPIFFANISKCKDQIMKKINEIEDKKKKFKNLWRKIDTKIYTFEEKPYISKFGDIFIFDGREPHRASLLKKNGYRAIIIFECMTDENRHLYERSILENRSLK